MDKNLHNLVVEHVVQFQNHQFQQGAENMLRGH